MVRMPFKAATACVVAGAIALVSSTALAQRYWPEEERYYRGPFDGYGDEGRDPEPDFADTTEWDPVDYERRYAEPGIQDQEWGRRTPIEPAARYGKFDEKESAYRSAMPARQAWGGHRSDDDFAPLEEPLGESTPLADSLRDAPSDHSLALSGQVRQHYGLANPPRMSRHLPPQPGSEPETAGEADRAEFTAWPAEATAPLSALSFEAPTSNEAAPSSELAAALPAAPGDVGSAQSLLTETDQTPAAALSNAAGVPGAEAPQSAAALLPDAVAEAPAPLVDAASGAPPRSAAPEAAAALMGPTSVATPAPSAVVRPLLTPAPAVAENLPALAAVPPSPTPMAGLAASGTGNDTPLATCTGAVEHEKYHVSAVESAATFGPGWEVKGRTKEGLNFTCQLDGKGQVSLLDLDDLARE